MVTREQIEQMGDGREMDALIAEYVMGWKKSDTSKPRTENLEYFFSEYNGHCWRSRGHKDFDDLPYSYTWERWEPSVDYSAAFEVVKKLAGQGDGAGFALTYPFRPRLWIASFDFTEAVGVTAPLAICRAALLAFMEREKQENDKGK